MRTVSTISELRALIAEARKAGKRIGFVPTMGALHQGHLSLVRRARELSDFVVMSIFVNPLQFNSAEDFSNYPRTVADDGQRAADAGVDLLFVPTESELYPSRSSTMPTGTGANPIACTVKAGSLASGLCGAARPGHFDGVVTVVSILFHLVAPDCAVFGEKDFQQLRVIQQMVRDLQFPVTIVPGETVRDSDGLALSSRNLRLSAEERFSALYISATLFKAQEMVRSGERSGARLRATAAENLEKPGGLRIDYVEIVDAETLQPIESVNAPARMLIAAFVGPVRLIDNIALERS